MDMTEAIAPNSQQLDAIDLIDGPRTFTIVRVEAGSPTDPRPNIYFADFPRPWRPGKNMSRVLVAAWGRKGEAYVGKSLTLYRDPNVVYGKDKVGGSRIVAMSDIDGPLEATTLESQGRAGKYLVKPLPESVRQPANESHRTNTDPTPAQIAAVTDVAELRDLYRAAKSDEIRALITARRDEIEGGA